MDLLKKLTIKNLRLNRKRTIVTMIGIILSVALLSAVSSMFMSARQSLIDYEIKQRGNYHYSFKDVSKEDIKNLKENRKIQNIYYAENLGYSKLDGIKNVNKPYLYVRAYTRETMKQLSINLVEGRLPQNENEIVIPKHLKTNGRLELKVGEQITLNIGERENETERLTQQDSYSKNEKLVDAETKTYTITGIMERPGRNIEPYSAPGYTAITYLSEENITDKTDIYVRYTNKGRKEHLKTTAEILGVDAEKFEKLYNSTNLSAEEYSKMSEEVFTKAKYNYDENEYLISLETGITGESTLKMLLLASVIVVIIIIVTSVFCIKNSFDISITEKIKQYGMLASIGATKKQIRKNVYFEATILGVISIPIGILSGILAAYILIIVSNSILGDSIGIKLVFKFSILACLFAMLLGIITIYLSASKSARKASKIAPITAIRNSDELKLKAKKIKSPKFISKLFGIGGEISYKNLKRSRKKYRTTVISIFVCVTVFIVITSFTQTVMELLKLETKTYNYDISVSYEKNENNEIEEKVKSIIQLDDVKDFSIINRTYLNIKPKYTEQYKKLKINDEEEENQKEHLSTVILNKEQFEKYIKSLGLKTTEAAKKGILINEIYDTTYDEEKSKYITQQMSVYSYNVGDVIEGKSTILNDDQDLIENDSVNIEIAKITDKVPLGVQDMPSMPILILNEEYYDNIKNPKYDEGVFIKTNDDEKIQKEIEEILKGYTFNLNNVQDSIKSIKSIYFLIGIFAYGFIIVIALIGITSIFNTVTTNMSLRAREFAMLKSIGMTKKEFDKMIRLESIFMAIKSLFFAIPIGIFISYRIYKLGMNGTIVIKYQIPFLPVIGSIIAIYILILAIMKYSINKINKQNTIETIRNENI